MENGDKGLDCILKAVLQAQKDCELSDSTLAYILIRLGISYYLKSILKESNICLKQWKGD